MSSTGLKFSRVVQGALPDKPLPDGSHAGSDRKIYSIQVLRGIAALAVVFYHLGLVEKKYSPGQTLLPDGFAAGRSGVDLFFVISGFIMVLITRKNWGGKSNSAHFLVHRFARIYPNYWFYFFLTVGVTLVEPAFVNASQAGRFNFLSSFFLLPSRSLPLVMVAWSLVYELFFYLLFALLIRCRERMVIILLACWLVALVGLNLIPLKRLPPGITIMISPYSIEFIFGAFAALVIGNPQIRRIPNIVLYLSIGAALVAVPFLFPRLYGDGSFTGRRLLIQTLVFGGLYTVLVIAAATIEWKKRIHFPKGLVMLGDISFTVYLCQVLIMGATGRIWAAFLASPGWLDNVLFLLATTAVILVYSYFAHRIIEKPSYGFVVGKLLPKRKPAVSH
jgi:peptidoglycan/LPS O-acetylase OafA/YrhL